MFWFYPIISIAAASLIGGVVVLAVHHYITHKDIKERLNALHIDNAFKYKILKAKEKSVRVGIFDCEDEQIDEVEFTSDAGISSAIAKAGNEMYRL